MSSTVQQRIKIGRILLPKSKIKSLGPKANCYQAFKSLLEQNLDLLPIMVDNSLKGIISRKALMHRLVLELKYGISLNHELIKEKVRRKRAVRKVRKES